MSGLPAPSGSAHEQHVEIMSEIRMMPGKLQNAVTRALFKFQLRVQDYVYSITYQNTDTKSFKHFSCEEKISTKIQFIHCNQCVRHVPIVHLKLSHSPALSPPPPQKKKKKKKKTNNGTRLKSVRDEVNYHTFRRNITILTSMLSNHLSFRERLYYLLSY